MNTQIMQKLVLLICGALWSLGAVAADVFLYVDVKPGSGPSGKPSYTPSTPTPRKPASPANLTILVQFEEPDGNRALDADERASFKVAVKNDGPGTARNVRLKVTGGGPGIRLPYELRVGDVGVGQTVNRTLSVSADRNLKNGKAEFKVVAAEQNGFDSQPFAMVVETRAFLPPKLMLVDIGINDHSQNGQVEPLEVVEITARVQNQGQGKARGVQVTAVYGANVFPAPGTKTSSAVGDLKPGEFKDVTFAFLTNRRITAGQPVPVEVKVNERAAGQSTARKLGLVMNQPANLGPVVVASTPRSNSGGSSLTPAGGLPGSDDVDRRIPKGKQGSKWDVAVVIGNRNYSRPGVPKVDFAHRDAGVLKEYLVRTMGFRPENILMERDVTKGTMETLFGATGNARGKLYNYVKPGKSRVFVYYVGHGAPDPNTGDGFFVPVDADPDYIAASGYPLSTFYANLKQIPAKEMTIVLDACFSGKTQNGLLFKNVSPALLKVRETQSNLTSGAVLSSSQGDQLSTWYPKKKHSLFTYYFLKGLQGAADANKDGTLTMAEVEAYVSEHVPYMARRLAGKEQQPKLEGRKDLVLARYTNVKKPKPAKPAKKSGGDGIPDILDSD